MNALHDLLHFGFQNALVATLLALGVGLVTRSWRNPLLGRTLWLLVLIKLVIPPLWQMPLPLPAAPATASTTAPAGTFQSPDFGRELTDPQTPREPRRAIRFASDPATLSTTTPSATTLAATGSATDSSHPAPSGWIDDGISRGPAGALTTPYASTRHRPPAEATAAYPSAGSMRLAAAITALAGRLPDGSFIALASGVSLSGSIVMLLLIGRRTWRFAHHLRQCPPASAADQQAVTAIARQVGLSRTPEVRSSAATHPPLVWCLGLRPVLVLPRSLMQQLTGDERKTVVAHELAHIKRGDHLVRLLEAAVITLFWWHPVVWWARRELQRYEEQCCDADVLQICPDSPETYVGVLMKTVEFLQARNRPVAVAFTSAMAQKHSLVERIERILGDGRPARWSWASRLTTCALVALLPLSVGWGAGDEQTKAQIPARQTANEADHATPSPADAPDSAAASQDRPDASAEATSPVPTGRPDTHFTVLFKFEGPQGLKAHRGHYRSGTDDEVYIAPFRIELADGAAHPLTLSEVPGHAGLRLYPTLEVAECKPQHAEFLQHNSVPIKLTNEDFDQVAAGNFVTKVIYAPDHEHQQLALVGLEVLVSTRLDPELDPVEEAERRGTIIAVLRLGNRRRVPVVKQQELVPFDRPYGELGYSDGEYGPHYETVRLATHPPVQDELDLSASQRRRLAPISTSLMHKSDRWPRSSDHPDLLKEEYDCTLSILSAAQKQRLDEIIFRRLGYAAFLQPQHAEQIGLTPQQSEQFRQAWQKHVQRGEKGWKGDEGRQAYHQLQAETYAALTPQQRQRYADRIGDPVIETNEEVTDRNLFFFFIENVLGGTEPDAKLYPLPVREDGTITLPLIPPIQVRGLDAAQVREKVREAYLKAEIISPVDEVLVSSAQQQRTLQQQHDPKAAPPTTLMPEFVNEVLHWLPKDTETIIVSRDFKARTIRDDANWKKSLAEPDFFDTLTRSLAAVPLFDLPPQLQELFTDEQIEWAILGGRNYEFTSAFGGYRFDGCTVLRFAEPILKTMNTDSGSYESAGETDPVAAAIQKAAKEHWLIAGKNVYVFPVNEKEREPWVKPRTGEGLYVVIHDKRTMILATSDVYLLQTLRRMDDESRDTAAPRLPMESTPTDFSAGTWGVRRIPLRSALADPTTVSHVFWSSTRSDQPDERFFVRYTQRGRVELLEPLQQHWLRSETPAASQTMEVQKGSRHCDVVIHRNADPGNLLPTLLFPIQGLPATSF